ncbi:site-specific integrase [Limnohabitans sp. Hippo4]|uniref:tyrosine-type recombinase/integrase n=1 Tax=Limnohabitans sp. Hippo4 TaxID=1826167 RepID=UPI000D3BFC62|nr:site-specific integrase [Limnohabitans sp. Hippo4]
MLVTKWLIFVPIINLTNDFLKQLDRPKNKKKEVFFDITCRGLMFEVRNSGGRTYYLKYRDGRGHTRQQKLADARDITLRQARQLADKKKSQIAMGHDPLEAKRILKQIPTVTTFIHTRYLPYVESYKRSWKCDKGLLKNHIEPIWGDRYLDQITKDDIIELMAKHRETHAPGSCNRLLILLRYMFSLPSKWDLPYAVTNPTKGIPLMKEETIKERFLSSDEAQTLNLQLLSSDNPMLQYIVPMLLLTGARKREVLDARWEDFDFERRTWRIHTTKLGKPRHVPISDGVKEVLKQVPKLNTTWVFPNPKTLKPYVSIWHSWNRARSNADLAEVRMHDLRHSYASFLVNSGRSLFEVQRLLGHTQVKTTQRYAHLSHETLLDASNAVTLAVGPLFSKE